MTADDQKILDSFDENLLKKVLHELWFQRRVIHGMSITESRIANAQFIGRKIDGNKNDS